VNPNLTPIDFLFLVIYLGLVFGNVVHFFYIVARDVEVFLVIEDETLLLLLLLGVHKSGRFLVILPHYKLVVKIGRLRESSCSFFRINPVVAPHPSRMETSSGDGRAFFIVEW
jgi:hypothetical protein